MNKLKVSTRLALLVGAMSLLLLAVGLLGIFALGRSNDALRTVYEDRAVPATQIGEIKSLLLHDRMAVAQALLQPTPEVIKERTARIEANQVRIEQTWKAYMATYLTPDEAKLAAELGPELTRIAQEGVRPAVAALRAGDLAAATKLSQQTLHSLFVDAEPAVEALLKLQIDVAKSEYDAAIERFQLMRTLAIAAVVVGLLFGAGVGTWLARSLTAQLGAEPAEAAAVARHVAAGNLGIDIALKAGDSASLMAQMKTMRDSLAQVVGEVRQHAEGVATASAQIAQGNGDLSGRTEEQASALQQTAASMEQLGTTVTQNADNARTANQLAQGASTVAVQGGDVVSQLVSTMKEIDASSKRIADIIGTIDGIAFQTNILALNAAVEAARAGEQGRGFAVVASEVRALAGRSAEAAREIKSLIAVSVERVERGSALADRAGTTMTDVVGSIRRVSDLVSEISAATTEQSAGVTQVGSAMTQMDQATQQNAALVEESAAAAESLKHQAHQLVRSVAVFSLAPARA